MRKREKQADKAENRTLHVERLTFLRSVSGVATRTGFGAPAENGRGRACLARDLVELEAPLCHTIFSSTRAASGSVSKGRMCTNAALPVPFLRARVPDAVMSLPCCDSCQTLSVRDAWMCLRSGAPWL